MPFNASDLTALTAANGFTLWHYRTPDARASVVAPGYFAGAEPPLLPGDIIIVQAADATALVPIRGSALAGGGVTVDLAGLTPNLLRSATLLVDVMVSAAATARAVLLDAIPGVLVEASSQTVAATITGPIAQATFALRDANGADVRPPQTVPVSAGRASATFVIPGAGSGYRFSVADASDPTLFNLSAPFVVSPLPRLLTEGGGRLLLETGGTMIL